MSSPYSGATPVGGQSGYPPEPPPANYAVPPTYDQGQAGSSAYGEQSYADESYGASTGAHAGNLGTPTTEAGRPDVEGVSVGQLISEVTTDLSVLMRQELALAKAELQVEAKKAGQGAGMFGAAGLAGLMTVIFLSIALWWALSHLVGHSWSALIVAVLWAIIGAVAFSMGRKKFRQVNPKPERTVDTLQQVPGALKPH
ncbi:Putative Holin-X, holin superfamily III [Geodermatophilus saharensis]|uniref:Putative Holin-X, holin superfamily III n=1 Tax=Geodermatophilus saharensis TaxID=1137994 RepID=A0A239J0H8_9ACTN|nr:phage holin family protein [Geodermatophilus saharensis]SNS98773.1 Putative Holin-X, holin superfamily III [Geodermatophilus saharensis]